MNKKKLFELKVFGSILWLKSQYKDIDVRYIIHDATAKEVDENIFFRTRESGGTLISSAFSLCKEMIKQDYPQEDWNIYPFHFSDGDNWSIDDTKLCLEILENDILPVSNMFCYGQVESRYGSGQFYKDLSQEYGESSDHVVLSKIRNQNEILPSIKKISRKKKMMSLTKKIGERLKELQDTIEQHALDYGLSFNQVVFETCSYETINILAAQDGFPTRYPHWRFGMQYDQLSKGSEYGFQKIYEMVINTNPCYAFLLQSNNDVDQKIVMSHVYGHADFFKNNAWFRNTNQNMISTMANNRVRFKKYIDRHGHEAVENFIDQVLSLENLLDINVLFEKNNFEDNLEQKEEEEISENKGYSQALNSFMRSKLKEAKTSQKEIPKEMPIDASYYAPRDILQFLMEKAPIPEWQADIIGSLRQEAYYFCLKD